MVFEKHEEIKPYGKEDFCKDVCGMDNWKLIEAISAGYVEKTDNSIGRDMPRDKATEFVDRFEIFMDASFQVPLLPKSSSELYKHFRDYMSWEREIHPLETHSSQRKYWEPYYTNIEGAYCSGDEEEFRRSIADLVDAIIHD
jgi:hypothetical protein